MSICAAWRQHLCRLGPRRWCCLRCTAHQPLRFECTSSAIQHCCLHRDLTCCCACKPQFCYAYLSLLPLSGLKCGSASDSARVQEADTAAQATDAARIKDVVSRCGAMASQRPRASYATKNLEQDLTRLLKSGNVEQHRDVLERPQAASALAGVPCLLALVHCCLQLGLLDAAGSREGQAYVVIDTLCLVRAVCRPVYARDRHMCSAEGVQPLT